MKKCILIALIFVCQFSYSQENKNFAKGYEYYQAGDFKMALEYFDKSVKESSACGDCYCFNALLLARQGNINDALPLFNKAIELSPVEGAYYGDRGIVLAQLGKSKEALHDFEFAAKYDSLNPARHFNLAAYYLNQGNCQMALKYLDNCLKVDPNHLQARFKRAICFIQANRRDDAIADFTYFIEHFTDQSTALNPGDYYNLLGTIYYMRGGVYGEAGQYDKAVADLKQSIKYKQDDPDFYNNLGYYLIFTKDVQNSIQYLDQAIKMNASTQNYNSRAFAYFKLGKLKLAEADALKAKSLDVDYPESYYNLALIYNGMGNPEAACTSKKNAEKLGSTKAKELKIKGCK